MSPGGCDASCNDDLDSAHSYMTTSKYDPPKDVAQALSQCERSLSPTTELWIARFARFFFEFVRGLTQTLYGYSYLVSATAISHATAARRRARACCCSWLSHHPTGPNS